MLNGLAQSPFWPSALCAALLVILIALIMRLHCQRNRHHAELKAQIHEREERLKLALWGAGDMFWNLDIQQKMLHRIGADYMLNIAGNAPFSIDDWQENSIHPDDFQRTQQRMLDYLAGKTESFVSEHRIRNAQGEWVWVRARGRIVEKDAHGMPVRVAGTLRDITADRQAESERRIASEVLRNMKEAVAVLDLNFRFVSINPAFSKITGYSEDAVLGMPDSLLESFQHSPEFYYQAHQELSENGHFRGEISLRRADESEFLGWVEKNEVCDSSGIRTHYVWVLSDITEKKRVEQEMRYLANYDILTGLPNRTLLGERLNRALGRAKRHGSHVALLFLDLDHFKDINDSLGHAVGDEVLKTAAGRLLSVIGTSDTVARLGGDEFTIMMEDVYDMGHVSAMATQVIDAFRTPISDNHEIDGIIISPSIGIALYPEHAQNNNDLLKFADAAMYRAKARGRNTFQIYDEALDAEVRRNAAMTAALRRALERDEFYLEFQLRQRLDDQSISSVEALLRWRSGEFGQVSPATFIPLAEESGLILSIGEWVLEEACHCLQAWRQQGIGDDIAVAVNISSLQLSRGNLRACIEHVLASTGLPAKCLELELTESMLMDNAEQAIRILQDLKALGVRLAIDDFGTGYSSLSQLKRLPIDTLKIDKEFIRDLSSDPDDEAITTIIIWMAHTLGLSVVAEGVETTEQLNYLREHKCDEIQGYLLARPMRADACLRLLQTL